MKEKSYDEAVSQRSSNSSSCSVCYSPLLGGLTHCIPSPLFSSESRTSKDLIPFHQVTLPKVFSSPHWGPGFYYRTLRKTKVHPNRSKSGKPRSGKTELAEEQHWLHCLEILRKVKVSFGSEVIREELQGASKVTDGFLRESGALAMFAYQR